MSEWRVELELFEGKTSKFWRARTEGTELYVNWGRINSDGQTQVKSFSSAEKCQAELEKLEGSKRKKGYVESGTGGGDIGGDDEPQEALGPQSEDLMLDEGGRKVSLQLSLDGSTVRTVVTEYYQNDGAATAAFTRLRNAMEQEGYKPQS